ncbi:MAG TPA: AhpC/TSA family protein [Acidimicrobiia bacterium]|nr:AhpC/TSA family protein [Acidimicrobiia bacterium]
MHCREHVAQLRDASDTIAERGAEIVAIGTGDASYAAAFVRDERIEFPVLVDDDGDAARLASVPTASWARLLGPSTWRASVATLRRGHRVHAPGARPAQLGATFVVGPGPVLHYEHLDPDSVTHAPIASILAAIPS